MSARAARRVWRLVAGHALVVGWVGFAAWGWVQILRVAFWLAGAS